MATKGEKACGFSPDDFKKLLKYDPETGLFYWLVDIRCGANKRLFRKAGDSAGGADGKGYIIICVNYQRFLAHRLAWYIMHGEWPADVLDHMNLDRADNRIANLRAATDHQNRSNTPVRTKYGLKGVNVPKNSPNKFVGQITVNGKNHYLGTFGTAEEAHAAYCNAATKAFGEFARFL